ncbi:MAG TPA: YggT family protein [Caulobacteraceae bacterium]|jgi:YggT family protein|nr:YggT family protein [Caulobacteraceae bacterium]
MHAILNFTQYLVHAALQIMMLVVVVYVVFSWLAYFNVINMRNQTVWRITRMLEQVAEPLLRPFRRIIPTPGGLDLSPLLFLLLVGGIDSYLVPPFFAWLHTLAGPATTTL